MNLRAGIDGLENHICHALNVLLCKTIINRLPAKIMMGSRFADTISTLLHGQTGLDLGCGTGSKLPHDRLRWFGVDVHLPSLLQARRKRIYQGLVCASVINIGDWIRPKSVDVVIAVDLIEHFNKKESMSLIHAMESIARKLVVILTPNGFVRQDNRVVKENPYMQHRSGWTVNEMAGLGYRVVGYNGWKGFVGPRGYVRRRLVNLFQILMIISRPWVECRPELAFHLLCLKSMEVGPKILS